MNIIQTYRRLRADADARVASIIPRVPTFYRFGLGAFHCLTQRHTAPDTGEAVTTHWFVFNRTSIGLVHTQTPFANNGRVVRFAIDLSRGVRLYGGRHCLMVTRRRPKAVAS